MVQVHQALSGVGRGVLGHWLVSSVTGVLGGVLIAVHLSRTEGATLIFAQWLLPHLVSRLFPVRTQFSAALHTLADYQAGQHVIGGEEEGAATNSEAWARCHCGRHGSCGVRPTGPQSSLRSCLGARQWPCDAIVPGHIMGLGLILIGSW